MGQITDNAIAWVQVRNAGAWRSATWVAMAYGVVVIGISTMILVVNQHRSGSLDGMPSVLLGLQAIIAGGITMIRILSAIERDTRAKILESHRLMPIDPRLAVLGYAAGGALPAVPIMLVNFVLGGVAAGNVGLPITWWLWANGVLLSWCIFMWCVAAGGGMLGTRMGLLILAPVVATFMTFGALTMVVPGLAPMVTPLAGKTIFSAQSIGPEELVAWIIAMMLQLPVAWVFILAGARRFRLGDIPGMTGPLGSLLVLILGLSSVVVVLNPEMVPRHLQREISGSTGAQTVGTLIAMMLLGSLTALWHVSRHTLEFQGKYRGWNLWIHDAGIALAVVVAAVAFLLVAPFTPPKWQARIIWTMIELPITVTTALIWARWAARCASPVIAWSSVLVAGWVLPLIVGALLGVRPTSEDTISQTVMQISPFALVSEIWSKYGDITIQVPSLAMQLVLPSLGAILLLKGMKSAEPVQK